METFTQQIMLTSLTKYVLSHSNLYPTNYANLITLGKDCSGTEPYLEIVNHFFEKKNFFRKFYDCNICHFGPAKPN